MEIIRRSSLNKEEIRLLKKAKLVAQGTFSNLGHRIGCVIKCKNGDEFEGATNIRSRVIGSTCAERMALDQVFFRKNRNPELCVLIGKLPQTDWRGEWSDDKICTPCGVCLETFRQTIQILKLKDIHFLCSSWNEEKILRTTISSLFPSVE